MADIGDIVVTAHSDDADDDDGMVPASRAVIRAVMPAPPVEVAGGGCSQQLKITCYLLLLPAAAG